MVLSESKTGRVGAVSAMNMLDLIKTGGDGFKDLIWETFPGEKWVEVFLADTHHGFTHGDQVRAAGRKLLENLTVSEEEALSKELSGASGGDELNWAVVIVSISSVFHDCGRFDDQGIFNIKEQKFHHVVSARRAKHFCDFLNMSPVFPLVEEAILCHDFQSREMTPYLDTPSTIVGKIVQSADQMGWFHPDSLSRTLDYNVVLGNPFFDEKLSLDDRLKWTPGENSKDALTVMLKQLFGPTGIDRFGIEYARKKVHRYKEELERNILKVAGQYNQAAEARELSVRFREMERGRI